MVSGTGLLSATAAPLNNLLTHGSELLRYQAKQLSEMDSAQLQFSFPESYEFLTTGYDLTQLTTRSTHVDRVQGGM